MLLLGNPVVSGGFLAAFTGELVKLGWVDGQNLQLIYRFADGDVARLPALASELVALEPDALFAGTVPPSLALAHATTRIPVVGHGSFDPIAVGLVKDAKHPGGNVTGTANWGGVVWGKRLELMRAWLPRMMRIAAIYNPEESTALAGFTALQDYTIRSGIRMDPLIARNAAEIRAAISALETDRPDALFVVYDAANLVSRDLICKEAARMRLPTMTDISQYTDFGCLAAFGFAAFEAAREGARMLSDILRGASPADMPLRQPTRSEFIINARTAAAIGLAIPPQVRLLADRVIE